MSLLKAEPPGPVKSLEELLAIAHAMEHEAANRYAQIAERMRSEGNPELAEVFEHLSSEEQGHLDNVVHWSESQRGKAPDPAQIRWKIPETFDDEGTASTDPRLVSAYRVLAMAVRNEDRAFAFWSYVAAQTQAPDVRHAAEIMAREELGHVATLRRERRTAFHAERAGSRPGDIVSESAALERRLAVQLRSLALEAPTSQRRYLEEMAEEANRHAQELEMLRIVIRGVAAAGGTSDDPVVLAELLTERYLEAADLVQDETAMRSIQALAARAITRLVWLRSDLPEINSRTPTSQQS